MNEEEEFLINCKEAVFNLIGLGLQSCLNKTELEGKDDFKKFLLMSKATVTKFNHVEKVKHIHILVIGSIAYYSPKINEDARERMTLDLKIKFDALVFDALKMFRSFLTE